MPRGSASRLAVSSAALFGDSADAGAVVAQLRSAQILREIFFNSHSRSHFTTLRSINECNGDVSPLETYLSRDIAS